MTKTKEEQSAAYRARYHKPGGIADQRKADRKSKREEKGSQRKAQAALDEQEREAQLAAAKKKEQDKERRRLRKAAARARAKEMEGKGEKEQSTNNLSTETTTESRQSESHLKPQRSSSYTNNHSHSMTDDPSMTDNPSIKMKTVEKAQAVSTLAASVGKTPAIGMSVLKSKRFATLSKADKKKFFTEVKIKRKAQQERRTQALTEKKQRHRHGAVLLKKTSSQMDVLQGDVKEHIAQGKEIDREEEELNAQQDAEEEEELAEYLEELHGFSDGEENPLELFENPAPLSPLATSPANRSTTSTANRSSPLLAHDSKPAAETKENSACSSHTHRRLSFEEDSDSESCLESVSDSTATDIEDEKSDEEDAENESAVANLSVMPMAVSSAPVPVSALEYTPSSLKLFGKIQVGGVIALNSFDERVNKAHSIKNFLTLEGIKTGLPQDSQLTLDAWSSNQVLPKRFRQNFCQIEFKCPQLRPTSCEWYSDTGISLFLVMLALARAPGKVVLDIVKPAKDVYPQYRDGKPNKEKNPYRAMGKKKYVVSASANIGNLHWVHILIDPNNKKVEVDDSLYHLYKQSGIHPPKSYNCMIDLMLRRYSLPLLDTDVWKVSITSSSKQYDAFNCGPCVLMKHWQTFDKSTCPLCWENPPPIEMYRQLIYQELQKNMHLLGLDALFEKAVNSQAGVVSID